MSPRGSSETARDTIPPADLAEESVLDLDVLNADLADAPAGHVVRWAAGRFPGRLAVSSSFGAQSAVMLHLVSVHAPGTPVILVDTGYLFPETYRFARDLTERFDLNLHVVTPRLTAAHQEALYGRLWEQGDEGVAQYLRINKVEPMQRALRDVGAEGWMAGLRARQTEHRSGLRRIDVQDGRIKVHPILHFTNQDVEEYIARHDLPLHPLVAEGYRSLGDWHSTLPTLPDQDPREGRILGKKRECGIHLTAAENDSLTSSKL
jgi:phosphoadenosine phosphosulfate reductase